MKWVSELRHDRRLWLLSLSALLLILTFIQPTLSLEQARYRYVFVIDISQSMNVRDSGITAQEGRLDIAKRAIDQALLRLSSQSCLNQAGLGLFTGHRTFLLLTPVEVCTHLHELRGELALIDPQLAWEARSEIAKGLFSGLVMAKQLSAPTRLVFLTDGHEAPPINPALPPKFNKGVPGEVAGLIVGIGGLLPVPIPKLNKAGEISGYWNSDEVLQIDTASLGRRTSSGQEQLRGVVSVGDTVQERLRNGTEHLSQLHEDYLQQLAAKTQLNYLRLNASQDLAERLLEGDFAEYSTVESDARGFYGAAALLLLGLLLLLDQYGRFRKTLSKPFQNTLRR